MSRLIDADKLLKDMKMTCIGNCDRCDEHTILSSDLHCGLVDRQPTIQPQGIDKNRLIEFIDDIKDITMYEDEFDEYSPYEIIAIMDELIDFINQQPTTDGWIPVSSGELPKQNQRIIGTFEYGGRAIVTDDTYYPQLLKDPYKLIAWQPLPPAYKESE